MCKLVAGEIRLKVKSGLKLGLNLKVVPREQGLKVRTNLVRNLYTYLYELALVYNKMYHFSGHKSFNFNYID